MQLDHISTYTTKGTLIVDQLFDIFFVVDQLKLVDYAINVSNCNFKMIGIEVSSIVHIGGMNLTKK